MEFQDKILKCTDCGTEFLFTAGEQSFFYDKQFRHEPKRCKSCKAQKPSPFGQPTTMPRIETQTVCSQCGKQTTVPFKPTQGRPVLCRECFQGKRQAASA